MVCFALGRNPQNSYIFSLLIQLACCGLSCIRLKSPEQLHFVASYSSGVLWIVEIALGRNHQNSYILLLLIQVACCGLFCIWNPQNSYILLLLILLLLIQVACCGLSCIRLKSQLHFVASYSRRVVVCFALGWNPQNSYILLLLIQVACCGLFCIRLKSPEQLHFVASYSSGVLWFVLH